ncbi:uncharacterized protein Dana_GF16994, isoform B [Drosophila ananassae]|uniref:Uncharacterized protein, isoform B n=1 Tax=Drosophila ananassae TaxID=7217 RepID=A0A0P9C8E4_DROAN|nr:uncharacterized protein LOC6499783 isoform X2 [Drosophila ananassae]KPU79751.1 uncharacterized protein Dana_GF16994, isoform B [Drosophila ananassae]
MQPLKRFTQCGSLTMLFGIFIILFGVSSTALTTFGKTNNQPPPTHVPIDNKSENQYNYFPYPSHSRLHAYLKGRECANHDDCTAIDRTSCVKDPNDYRFRCLCGDDSAPSGGNCPDVLKGLRHKCNSNNDCEDGMVCQYENSNRTIGVSKFMSSKTKLCLCDNDNGYVEDILHDICSGANLQALVNILMSICSLLAPFVVSAHMRKHF